jgi:hypothetical protein
VTHVVHPRGSHADECVVGLCVCDGTTSAFGVEGLTSRVRSSARARRVLWKSACCMMWDDHGMSTADRASSERTQFEVRWNRRSFWSNVLFLFLIFLGYVAITVFASGSFRIIGMAGISVFGGVLLYSGVAGAKQLQRRPVAVSLSEFGVTFDRHDPVAWEAFREVRFGRVRPRWLFFVHPLYYIAFVPKRAADHHSLTPRKRMTTRIYGTTLVLITQTVTPSGDDILAAVERLSDVPLRR